MVGTKQYKMGLLGKKIGMTQYFDENGDVIPISVLQVGPCVVVQKKTQAKEGYNSIQLGFEEVAHRKMSRPARGHFEKKGVKPFRYLREIRLDSVEQFNPGQSLDVNLFQIGDKIDVTGITKGKGFQGVIKRHHKRGGPGAHGSRFHRTTGSIGMRTYPGRVFKNMKMPGHMGCDQVTTTNLKVVKLIPEENLIFVSGSVPGANRSLLVIKNRNPEAMGRVKVAAPTEQAQA